MRVQCSAYSMETFMITDQGPISTRAQLVPGGGGGGYSLYSDDRDDRRIF